jgi:AcrR family transcriptional regulator
VRLVKRLSREDWERAALEAMADAGVAAVAVEPLARRLGVTKGSFYGFFANRDELIEAALSRWEQAHVDAFVTSLNDDADPAERLRALVALATSAARTRTIQGRLLLESSDPRVREALQRVSHIRLMRLEGIFSELGYSRATAARRSTLSYALYIGLLQLAREIPERLEDEAALVEELLEILATPRRTGPHRDERGRGSPDPNGSR